MKPQRMFAFLGLALFLAFVCPAAAAKPPVTISSKADLGELEGRPVLLVMFGDQTTSRTNVIRT
jgi:hypothetical protein